MNNFVDVHGISRELLWRIKHPSCDPTKPQICLGFWTNKILKKMDVLNSPNSDKQALLEKRQWISQSTMYMLDIEMEDQMN